MTEPKAPAALTPAEWRAYTRGAISPPPEQMDFRLVRENGATALEITGRVAGRENGKRVSVRLSRRESCHALAALALLDQPFGFTRDHVDALRSLASDLHPNSEPFHTIADRIEALLPPEAP